LYRITIPSGHRQRKTTTLARRGVERNVVASAAPQLYPHSAARYDVHQASVNRKTPAGVGLLFAVAIASTTRAAGSVVAGCYGQFRALTNISQCSAGLISSPSVGTKRCGPAAGTDRGSAELFFLGHRPDIFPDEIGRRQGGSSSSPAALIVAPLRRGFFLGEQTARMIAGCVALWALAAFALWPRDERTKRNAFRKKRGEVLPPPLGITTSL
jgi:hypothetical protein